MFMPLLLPALVATQAPSLSPDLQTRLERQFQRIQAMDPQQRQRVLLHLERLAKVAEEPLKPALALLIERIRALDLKQTAGDAPFPAELERRLERFRNLSPAQRRKVVERLEAEAAQSSPGTRRALELLLTRLRPLTAN